MAIKFSKMYRTISLCITVLGFIMLFSACGGEDDIEDVMMSPCDGIEFNGNTLMFNDSSYKISEYNYSTAVGIEHNFRFKAFTESCADSVSIFLKFTKAVSFPDFSLAGEYMTVFDSQTQEFEEMSGSFDLGPGLDQRLLSGNTANIILLNESSYQILIDSPTASFGAENSNMKLDVVVPKE